MLAFQARGRGRRQVILIFHAVGMLVKRMLQDCRRLMDLSRAYVFRIGGVPVFTGFMLPQSGPFARAWRLFDPSFAPIPHCGRCRCWPRHLHHFFTHHYVRRSRGSRSRRALRSAPEHFKVWRVHRRMPLLVTSFTLVALFVGTGIGTFPPPGSIRVSGGQSLVSTGQARRLIPADDHLLRAGGAPAAAPAGGNSARSRRLRAAEAAAHAGS